MPKYIYPKHIIGIHSKIDLARNTCFVLMPFNEKLDGLFASIKAALDTIGFTCTRSDTLYNDAKASGPIFGTVVENILKSHFVIAVLTDKNTNVFYELGIAHTCREPEEVILVGTDSSNLPFNLAHLDIMLYSGTHYEKLTEQLCKHITTHKIAFQGRATFIDRYRHQFNTERALADVVAFFEMRQALWPLLLQACGGEYHPGLSSHEQEKLIHYFAQEMNGLLDNNEKGLHALMTGVFMDILLSVSQDLSMTRDAIADALRKRTIGYLAFDDVDQQEDFMIKLAIKAFKQQLFKRLTFEFILNYLAKPKIAGVDLKRGMIESFVLSEKQDAELRDWLAYALTRESQYLREEVADLLGDMDASESSAALLLALASEKNPYVARSIITALGKLRSCAACDGILSWLKMNADLLTAHSFILSHAQQAIMRIDAACGAGSINRFNTLVSEMGLSFDPLFL